MLYIPEIPDQSRIKVCKILEVNSFINMTLDVVTKEELAQLYKKLDELEKKVAESQKNVKCFNNSSLCEYLNVCPRTLQYWRDSGKLSFVQEGKVIIYTWENVSEFLSRHSKPSFRK